MGANPRIVTEDVSFTWDGVTQRLARGQILDVPAGGALEAAIGPGRLVPLYRAPAAAADAEPEEREEREGAEAPPAARRRAKPPEDGSDGKDEPAAGEGDGS